MNSEEQQFDKVTRQHKAAECSEVADVQRCASVLIHGEEDGPVRPIVRDYEQHRNNLAINEAV